PLPATLPSAPLDRPDRRLVLPACLACRTKRPERRDPRRVARAVASGVGNQPSGMGSSSKPDRRMPSRRTAGTPIECSLYTARLRLDSKTSVFLAPSHATSEAQCWFRTPVPPGHHGLAYGPARSGVLPLIQARWCRRCRGRTGLGGQGPVASPGGVLDGEGHR